MTKFVAIIPTRLESQRLPEKALLPLMGKPILWHIIYRLKQVKEINKIVLATTNSLINQKIVRFGQKYGVDYWLGNDHDVLDRIYQAANHYEAENIIRITHDCPLIDPDLIRKLIHLFNTTDADMASIAAGAGAKNLPDTFPSGLDAEIIKFSALKRAWKESTGDYDREHVTPYIWRSVEKFKTIRLFSPIDFGHYHLSVDTINDLRLITKILSTAKKEQIKLTFKKIINIINHLLYPKLVEEFELLKKKKFPRPKRTDCLLILSGEETKVLTDNGARIKLGINLFKDIAKSDRSTTLVYSGTKSHLKHFNKYVNNKKLNFSTQLLPDNATTLTQIKAFMLLIAKHNFKSVTIITHLWHIPRTRRYVEKFFPSKTTVTYFPVNDLNKERFFEETVKIIAYDKTGDLSI